MPARSLRVLYVLAISLVLAACGGGTVTDDDQTDIVAADVIGESDTGASDDAGSTQDAAEDTAEDACPDDPAKTAPGVCGCGVPDVDTDEDGTPDCEDACPGDGQKTEPGVCGCGVADVDSDEDGTLDCEDACPEDPAKVEQGECGCGVAEEDADEDAVTDCVDNCPGGYNPWQEDVDESGVGDLCEDECDADGVLPDRDNCPCVDNVEQADGDEDGVGDACDACPEDPAKTEEGLCGCGQDDTDGDEDGTPDCQDACPEDPAKVESGACGCGVADTDGDGDGAADCVDECPIDPNKTGPGACGCGNPDTDIDGDGMADCVDGCPDDPMKTEPGVCGCHRPDRDLDGDGVPDCIDGCPGDGDKTEPGVCGCGNPDTDSDGDLSPDCLDECPADADKTAPGLCGCGTPDSDSDGDGEVDCEDGCPDDPLKVGPGTCGCGNPDTDSDDDATPDCVDGCPDDRLKTEPGICGCGVTDMDSDEDGTADCDDGCPADPHKTEPGDCGCGVADSDRDGDGAVDCVDGCPDDPDKTEPGDCGCGVADGDSDGDGAADCVDGCPDDPDKTEPGDCGCGVADGDSDGDGTPDCTDGCPDDPNKTDGGVCGCGVADSDSDGDGAEDCVDGCPDDPDKTEPGVCGCGAVEIPNCAEVDPPTPDPAEWLSAPQAVGTDSVTMTVLEANDESGVEYYFACVAGPCHDSGWQDATTWVDTGLAPAFAYTYQVMARDKSANQNETGWSVEASATTAGDYGYEPGLEAQLYDFIAVQETLPALSELEPTLERIDADVVHEASINIWEGLDGRFGNTFASRHTGFLRVERDGDYTLSVAADDGARLWLNGEPIVDFLTAGAVEEHGAVRSLTAGYHAIRLDFLENEDEAALVLSWQGPDIERQPIPAWALYHADPPDVDAPTPSPAEWESAPAAAGPTSLSMAAAPASDAAGVEYYFQCVEGDCVDSGWQWERGFEVEGLEPGTVYGYRLRVRDLSTGLNAGLWSDPVSVRTDVYVPDVINTARPDAELALDAAGLVVGDVSWIHSTTVAPDHVLTQSPVAGTLVPAGTSVNLVVSLGEATVVVPDVEGLDRTDAEAAIELAGLTVGTVGQGASCTVAPNGVILQSPAGGAEVPAGAAVSLLVSSGPTDVVFSELMYHAEAELAREEFLELHNPCPFPADISGWVIEGLGDYTFGAGATIEGGGYIVLAEDAASFEATYGFVPDYVYTDGGLSNGGEDLVLRTEAGEVACELEYDDVPQWPVTPDGLGPSLELVYAEGPIDTPRNWHASIAPLGHTAGGPNSVAADALPPWIPYVRHGTPTPDVDITVTASVVDAETVELEYLIGFGTPVVIPMADDGAHGDGIAGDNVWGAVIPAQPASTLVRYRVDATGPTGTMGYPRDDDTVRYTGTYLVDPTTASHLPIVHWIMDPARYADALAHYRTDEVEPALIFYDGVLYEGVNVRVRGQSSRGWPKKHWKIKFAQGHEFYDPALSVFPVPEFNLQCNYSDKAYMREVLSYETFTAIGAPSHRATPVSLYQNGEFFGVYTYVEAKDGDYLDRVGLPTDGSLYKAFSQCEYRTLDQLPGRFEKKNPEDGDYTELHDLLYGVNQLTGQARRDFLYDNIDIPRMITYLVGNCLNHNNDQVAKNYYLFRDTHGTQRWTMLAWDEDLTFGRSYQGAVLNDRIFAADDEVGRNNVSPSHPLFGDSEHQKWDYLWNRIIDALYEDAEFRAMYYRRLRTAMDEVLAEGFYEPRIDELAALMVEEVPKDRAKWSWYGAAETLEVAVTRLKEEYLAVRRVHLFETHRVEGEIPEAQSANPAVVITEIMYNPYTNPDDPTDDGGAKEFVELYNPSLTESVDISNYRLLGVDLTIPPGTVILPGEYLVVVSHDPTFRATYGSGRLVVAQYDGKLSGGGERLALLDRIGQIVDDVTYDDESPWPVEPDNGGPSLELIDPALDNALPTSWAPSMAAGGTPGLPNSVTP